MKHIAGSAVGLILVHFVAFKLNSWIEGWLFNTVAPFEQISLQYYTFNMLVVRVPFKMATGMSLWHLLADDLGMRVDEAYYGSAVKKAFSYSLVAARVAILIYLLSAALDAVHFLYIALVGIPTGIFYDPWRYNESVKKLLNGLDEMFKRGDDFWIIVIKLILMIGAYFFVNEDTQQVMISGGNEVLSVILYVSFFIFVICTICDCYD